MARLGIQEEEKLLGLKYINRLSLYIQQEMEFLNIGTLTDAFHYSNKLENKQKGKSRFTTKLTRRTFNRKSRSDFDKLGKPSQRTPPKKDHGKNKSRKYKRERRKQPLLGNGVITTIHHGMICINVRIRRHFWKNCQPLTFLTKPW